MEFLLAWARRTICLIVACCFLGLSACQYQAVSSIELQIHQARLDRNGLTPLQADSDLKVTYAIPERWEKIPVNKNILFIHQQWRSPNHHVGMGVAYIHTPIPLSAQMIIWFARNEYVKDHGDDQPDGKLIGEWSDSLGRRWFEAENALYHIKGYAMTHGFDAWIVYSGYRVKVNPTTVEIALAAKAADSIAPATSERERKPAENSSTPDSPKSKVSAIGGQ